MKLNPKIRRIIITLCLGGCLLMIGDTINLGSALMVFFIAGIIPGTNVALPPIAALIIMLSAIGLILRSTWQRLNISKQSSIGKVPGKTNKFPSKGRLSQTQATAGR